MPAGSGGRTTSRRCPLGPGKGPLAARIVLDDGSGLDFTETGTQKRLAIYVVRDPHDVPGIAQPRPRAACRRLHPRRFAGILERRAASQIKGVLRDQSVIAGIGNAYSDEILHVAKMSPFKPAAMTDDDDRRALRRDADHAARRDRALGRGSPRAS